MAFSRLAWYPKADKLPIPGTSTSSYTTEANRKGLLHTTEGRGIESAVGAYRNGGYAPHFTIEPGRLVQHSSVNYAASTLANRAGGAETNRAACVQIEICGTADPDADWDPNGVYYVENWSPQYLSEIAELMLWIEKNCRIPRQSTVTWRAYPASYGINASQRLSASQWTAYSGWLGHQHCPEGNTHGDPGALNIRKLFTAMTALDQPAKPIVTPPTEETPVRRDPFHQSTTTKTQPQKLKNGKWSLVKMSDGNYSVNVGVVQPCILSYRAFLYIDGLKAGQQVQVRSFTSTATGQAAIDHPEQGRTGVSGVEEFTATAGVTCVGWSDPVQELRKGEYLRVEVLVYSDTATVTKAQSKAVYWREDAA